MMIFFIYLFFYLFIYFFYLFIYFLFLFFYFFLFYFIFFFVFVFMWPCCCSLRGLFSCSVMRVALLIFLRKKCLTLYASFGKRNLTAFVACVP